MRRVSFLLICNIFLFIGCNKGHDINYKFTKDISTIFKFSIPENEKVEVNFSHVFDTDEDVEIYFGKGNIYKGSARQIPVKTYTKGEYSVIVNSSKLSLLCSPTSVDNGMSYLKQVKLNGLTEYVEVNFSNSGLEVIEIDENEKSSPMFAQKYFSLSFSNTKLVTIPENLFRKSTDAINFHACFYGCSELKTIPENLFKYNKEAINFLNCFSNCTQLTAIPENLFMHNSNVDSFHACFYGCSSLTTIPENLFKYNNNVTSFGFCFANCTNLNNIPENLFNNNKSVKSFYECFSNCTALIPNKIEKKVSRFYEEYNL